MNETNSVILNDRTYNFLKSLALIVLPAAGTLYFALSQIWGLPFGEEIVGTVVALEAFLGVVLGITSRQYYKSDARFDGVLDVVDTDDTKTFMLNYHNDPYDIDKKDEVIFRVNS